MSSNTTTRHSNFHSSKSLEKYKDNYTEQERKKLEDLYNKEDFDTTEFSLIKGKILNIGDDGAVLDIGLKADGILPLSELRELKSLKIGDEIEVYLESTENKYGNPVISRKKADLVKVWDNIKDSLVNNTVLQGIVKRRTKGGLIVNIGGVETFLPGSQIDVTPVVDFDKFIDSTIDVAVIKIKYSNDNVVVSHKALIEKEIESQRSLIVNNLEKGQILEGIVKNITNFGAFIDLGGIDGLLHITDISWSKVSHPEDILKKGQKIKVVVIGFDESKKKISLGMKQLTPHPWDSLKEELKEGSIVTGKIVNITDYGAFLEIQKGVEGLIHVSEMSWSKHVANPRDHVQIRETYKAKVLSIDRENKKMSLSLKHLKPIPWSSEVAGKKYLVGSVHKGKISNITNFGAFVELEPGLEGLLHISDLSWSKKISHPSKVLKVGEEVDVKILTIDIDNRKLTLGIKQLEENPWNNFETIFTVGSVHKGVVKKVSRHAVVELPYDIEAFAPKRGLLKKDKTIVNPGDILDFKILEFDKNEHRVVVSHTATLEDDEVLKKSKSYKKSAPKNLMADKKSTLGDIEELSELKQKMIKNEKKNTLETTSESKKVDLETKKETSSQKPEIKEDKKKKNATTKTKEVNIESKKVDKNKKEKEDNEEKKEKEDNEEKKEKEDNKEKKEKEDNKEKKEKEDNEEKKEKEDNEEKK